MNQGIVLDLYANRKKLSLASSNPLEKKVLPLFSSNDKIRVYKGLEDNPLFFKHSNSGIIIWIVYVDDIIQKS